MHSRHKSLEAARHYEIREAIVHRIDFHAALSGEQKLKLELLAHLVIFPDKGLEEYTLVSLADRLQHSLIEVLAIGIELHPGAANADRIGPGARKTTLRTVAFAPEIDADQNANNREL